MINIDITCRALKRMIVQNHIKQIYTIGLAAAAKLEAAGAAVANPTGCRGFILFCTNDFLDRTQITICVTKPFCYVLFLDLIYDVVLNINL